MKNKLKKFLQNQYGKLCLMMATITCTLVNVAMAAEVSDTPSTITSAFTTGFTQIVSDATGLIAGAVPIAVGLAGTIFLVRKAMSWFKSIAK